MKLVEFFSSTIGKKFLVAATGLFMIVFLLGHLLGNLEIFSGPEAVNQYAVFLRTMPKALWAFRILLILSVVVHVWMTISLTRSNASGRKTPYGIKRSRGASLASRTMMISGLTVLTFVVYHLAHYTFGITNPELMTLTDGAGRHHVYNMMVMGFSHPLVSGFYILAQILLAFHLSHGFASAFRTFGITDAQLYARLRAFSIAFATIIALLYISIPLSVLAGIVTLDY